MSVAVNGHRRLSSAAMSKSLIAGIKDVTPEETAQLAHGVQVIDENKEFTYVLPSPGRPPVRLPILHHGH